MLLPERVPERLDPPCLAAANTGGVRLRRRDARVPDQVGDEHGRCIPFGVAGDERMPQRVQGRVVDADLSERPPARPAARSVSTAAGCSFDEHEPGLDVLQSARAAPSRRGASRTSRGSRRASANADRGHAGHFGISRGYARKLIKLAGNAGYL